ncbi:hypothetical protein D3C71_1849850 [compost metagenome]
MDKLLILLSQQVIPIFNDTFRVLCAYANSEPSVVDKGRRIDICVCNAFIKNNRKRHITQVVIARRFQVVGRIAYLPGIIDISEHAA